MFLVAMMLLGCAPPTCEATCDKIVNECGFGASVELCVERCKTQKVGSGNSRDRHDVRDCFAKADCGTILTGKCLQHGSARKCDFGGYVAVSSSCLDGPKAFLFTPEPECKVKTKDDWGELGPPEWQAVGMEGAGNFVYGGDCTVEDPQATGVGACGECEVAQWVLF